MKPTRTTTLSIIVTTLLAMACGTDEAPRAAQPSTGATHAAPVPTPTPQSPDHGTVEAVADRMQHFLDSLEGQYAAATGDARLALRRRIDTLTQLRDTLLARYAAIRQETDTATRRRSEEDLLDGYSGTGLLVPRAVLQPQVLPQRSMPGSDPMRLR